VPFLGAVVLWGPGYVNRGFFTPLAFQFLVDGVGACPLVICFCYCFAFCFISVSTKYKVRRFVSVVCTDLR
jgi:hypothetical protein